ncbi:MAG: 3-oxoacyl-[acyl-carrier-protein] reductase [Victivallales bacterium]|jgi:3-oxoacyl-[acyl-carrier protein] reductase|nr:3-oxoacyl-[acyl-carrier-protein] reductase [Victivallales bacterium]MBT7163572.1 3-oxoacyl-[acyl-carrier-protein] reductase [Victivallales bacterium]MBT7302660.1 3-oxoacyl-[acyl-carrier-protein] reductase [Victivallales bacterium]
MSFEGRVAVITGGARGIGRSIAKELAAGGATLALVDVLLDVAEETAAEFRSQGVEAAAFAANVANPEDVTRMCGEVIERFGKIDILVNNAGITRDNLIMRMKEADWDAVIAVNLKGTFNCIKAVTRAMMKARYGRIVNIASVVGVMGNAGQANYSASKAGVIGLTKTAAKELASRNITVNAVAPGYIQTDMTDKVTDAARDAFLTNIPLGRAGQPEDVARAVRFLCSDDADYITGQVLNIDGGMVM